MAKKSVFWQSSVHFYKKSVLGRTFGAQYKSTTAKPDAKDFIRHHPLTIPHPKHKNPPHATSRPMK